MTHTNDDIPVMIGRLNKEQGLIGFKRAEVGHPVFEFKDRYIIYLESNDGKTTVAVPYYKDTLKTVNKKLMKASYSYKIKNIKGRNVISIIDQCRRCLIITNVIEDVIIEIEKQENINANDYLIIYRDTDGYWTGWDNKTQSFLNLFIYDELKAIDLLIQKQLL